MKNYLRVKVLSLAAEAKIIRKEQNYRHRQRDHAIANGYGERVAEYHDKVRAGLHEHRVTVVRNESRVANIAYGFLRGREYYEIEQYCYTTPNWKRVEELVMKYAEHDNPKYNRPVEEIFKDWKERAVLYIMATHDARAQEEASEPVAFTAAPVFKLFGFLR